MKLHLLRLIFFFLVFSNSVRATHIVGGDLVYQYLGNDQYRVKLTVYRDCFNGVPDFDMPAYLGVFDSTNNLLQTISLRYLGKSPVIPTSGSPCLSLPTSGVCYEVTTYDTVITLPALKGGYQLLYQRCCRNQTIMNIVDPGNTGASYYTRIPEMSRWGFNSSPAFKYNAPMFICVDEPFVFDHSATDADGDSLVYDICTPFSGADPTNPQPYPPALPLDSVVFIPPYSRTDMFNTSPPLSIDRKTGRLTVTPSTQGQFVFAVRVKEYRHGVYVGETKRDIQVNVRPCVKIIVSSVQSADYVCKSTVANFTNLSSGSDHYEWNFGDPASGTADTTTQLNAVHTFTNYGTFTIRLVAFSSILPQCSDTSYKTITLVGPLNPGFNTGITNCGASNTVVFTNTTVENPPGTYTYHWNYGNGDTSALKNPTYTYAAAGTYTIMLVARALNGCNDTLFRTIDLPPQKVANAGPDVVLCYGSAIQIGTSAQSGFSYLWNPAAGLNDSTIANPMASPGVSTTYTVTATNANGCSATDRVVVSIAFQDVQLAPSFNLCKGSDVQLNVHGDSVYTYNWQPAANLSNVHIGNPVANPPVTTTYTVTIVLRGPGADTCHIVKSTVVNVSNAQLRVNTDGDKVGCEGESVSYIAGSNARGSRFKWWAGKNFQDTLNTSPFDSVLTLIPAKPTATYYVIAYNRFCYDTTRVTYTADTIRVNASPLRTCAENTDTIRLVQISPAPLHFKWKNAPGIIGTDTLSKVMVRTPVSTVYYVTAYNDRGCSSEIAVPVQIGNTISVSVDAERDNITAGDRVTLKATPVINNYRYQWTSDNGDTISTKSAVITVSPSVTTTYYLRVTDLLNPQICAARVALVIKVHEYIDCDPQAIFIPNGFTPNGDGANDVLYVRSNNIVNIELLIFNRWGEKLTEIHNLTEGWDGTYNGKPAEPGVYVYYLRYTCVGDNARYLKKGNITLIR